MRFSSFRIQQWPQVRSCIVVKPLHFAVSICILLFSCSLLGLFQNRRYPKLQFWWTYDNHHYNPLYLVIPYFQTNHFDSYNLFVSTLPGNGSCWPEGLLSCPARPILLVPSIQASAWSRHRNKQIILWWFHAPSVPRFALSESFDFQNLKGIFKNSGLIGDFRLD